MVMDPSIANVECAMAQLPLELRTVQEASAGLMGFLLRESVS